MSETLRLIALVAPIAVTTLVTSLLARRLVTRAGLAYILIAIAVIASLVTVVDVLVLSHFMLLNPGNPAELVSVALYSVTAGVAAALIVGRSNTRALARLVATARALGDNRLDARAGELRAGPELRLLAATLDQAAGRLAASIEAERSIESQRRDLMTSISHDLRTPLANLRAMVEAIDDGIVRDTDTISSYAGEMRRSVMALVEMVDDLFELAQIDAAEFARDTRGGAAARGGAGRARPVRARGGREADRNRSRPRRRRPQRVLAEARPGGAHPARQRGALHAAGRPCVDPGRGGRRRPAPERAGHRARDPRR